MTRPRRAARAGRPSADHGTRGTRGTRETRETETILAFEPRQFVADGDTVAVIGSTTIEARPTGRVYSTDFVHVVTVGSGRITRFVEFFDTWPAAEAFRT